MAKGVNGNVFRRNLVVGNPPLQIDLDHPDANGLDIKNLAEEGTNTFRRNICLTSVHAPCPAVKRQQPDPQPQSDGKR